MHRDIVVFLFAYLCKTRKNEKLGNKFQNSTSILSGINGVVILEMDAFIKNIVNIEYDTT